MKRRAAISLLFFAAITFMLFMASIPACLPLHAADLVGFTRLTAEETSLAFTNVLPFDRHLTNQILPNGSGVAAGDIDGDGFADLFFSGLGGGSRLYKNLRDFKFQDITGNSGINLSHVDATGCALADLDGDGALDLIVNSIGAGTHIFWNDGHGRFMENSELLNPHRGGTSIAVADIDGDGFLDLYITNYRADTVMDAPGTRFSVKMIDGKPVVNAINGRPITDELWRDRFTFVFNMAGGVGKFSHEENGEADVLFHNEGNRRFKQIPFEGGAFLDETGAPLQKPPLDWGLSAMFRDFNGDGAPDLYVCNDFNSPDRIWLNDGHGRFRAIARAAIRHTSLSSMAVDFADINRDGHDDIFVADMLSPDRQRRLTQRTLSRPSTSSNPEDLEARPQYQRNSLFVNRGDGVFLECADYSGIEATDWSWSCIFLDVDLDGYEDLLIANGFVRDNLNIDVMRQIDRIKAEQKLSPGDQLQLRKLFPPLKTGNFAFRNLGNLRFEDYSAKWAFNAVEISQGMCLADLDNDGDMDVVINTLNERAAIYRNESAAPRIGVRLKGKAPNTRGIGAKVSVLGGAIPQQTQEIIAGGRYLSSDDPMRSFATGSLTNRVRIEVTWRSGQKTIVENLTGNRVCEIDEATAKPASTNDAPRVAPLFEDTSSLLSHKHDSPLFNDFEREPGLPHKIDGFGPGVSWHDIDGDGWEDLIIGCSRGSAMSIFLNSRNGPFTKSQKFTQPVTRNQPAALGLHTVKGRAILASFSNYEDRQIGAPALRELDFNAQEIRDLLPSENWSFGPIALADIDGDGDLDLFVGGRVIPGKYPEAVPSRIYLNNGSGFELAQELKDIGVVNAAVWSDILGDRQPELVLACDWGPVRIFTRLQSIFKEVTAESGLTNFVGKWNGVTTGDFDGDGLLDIVASNWGENTEYERYITNHLSIHFGEVDGREAVFLSAFDKSLRKQAPITSYEQATKFMPSLLDRFPTAAAYARAGIDDVLGDDAKRFHQVEITSLQSTLFLNRGGRFVPVFLPLEAQLAPAFGICVGDADGDGAEDIFLSQNFYGMDLDKTRLDCGRGLWLHGDNKGHFTSIPGQVSGVIAYGEQRGAALCDYDHDGRIDLTFTQRGAETKLYHNVRAEPGLRVTLRGPSSNPTGVGAIVRVRYRATLGPAREIHCGSGYLSQDSPTLVFGDLKNSEGLHVRWPSASEQDYALPENACDVELLADGKLRVLK